MQSTLQMPWDQNHNEPVKAFAYFKSYLALPERPRRIENAAKQHGITLEYAYTLSSIYSWVSRAAVYDAYVSGITEKERADAIRAYQLEVIQNAVSDVRQLRSLWEGLFNEYIRQDNPKQLTPIDMVRLARARNEIEIMARRTAELPSTYTANSTEGELPDNGTYNLTLEGAEIDRRSTETPQLSGENQQQSDAV